MQFSNKMNDHTNVLFVTSQQPGRTFAIQELNEVLEMKCHFELRC